MHKIEKQGTIDLDIVESNPIIFKGKPWLMEYVRQKDVHGPSHSYHANALGKAYCRFRNLEDCQSFSKPFGIGYCFGNAFAENDHIVVTVTDYWGGTGFYVLESDDMEHWSEPRPIYENAAKRCYNSSLCKAANGKFVNALEIGDVADALENYILFAETTDFKQWKIIPGARCKKGAPVLRYYDGWYFYICLLGDYTNGFNTCIFRSQDLQNWEPSPQNPILPFDEDDRLIHPKANLTQQQLDTIAKAVNINASDMDMCTYQGKTIVSYSWGDQKGHEFLALATINATERDFCFSCF